MIELALFIQVVVFAGVCLAFVLARSTSFFHPLMLYLIFHFLVFVARPLMVHGFGYDNIWRYMRYTADEYHFMLTLMVSSVGLVVFAVASLAAGRGSTEFSNAGLPPWTVAEKRAFVIVALLLGPAALYSASMASAGHSFDGEGDIQMTRDLATGIAIYTNTTGYIAEAHAMAGALCLLALWRFNFRWWAYLPFLLFIGYRAFLGWGRWGIITAFISLVMIYLYRHGRRWMRIQYLVLAIPVAILFQNLGMDRDLVRDYVEGNQLTNRVATVTAYADRPRDFWEQFDHPDFANFEFLAFILWSVPEKSGTYTYFTQYLQLFTEPIPRIIWKDKPVGAPVRLINLNDFGNFRSMTPSLPGDGWMSLGWVGLIVTMGLVGLFLGRVHRWFWNNQANPRVVMAYCIFLPLTIQWYRDGGISIAKFALFSLTPIILWTIFSRVVDALLRQGRAARDPDRPGAAFRPRPPPGPGRRG